MQQAPNTQTPYVFNASPDRSVGKYLGQAVLDTFIAMVIGVLASVPLIAIVIPLSGVRHFDDLLGPPETVRSYKCSVAPANDAALLRWAQTQPGVHEATVDRSGKTVRLRYTMDTRAADLPAVPLEKLGYRVSGSSVYATPLPSDPNKVMESLVRSPALAAIVISSAVGTAIGFIIWVYHCWKRARARGDALPRFFRGSTANGIVIGVFAGLLMYGLAAVYSFGLVAIFGNNPLINGPWIIAIGFPLWAKITTAVVGTLCAPVAEELFFRGTVFGSFAGAGHAKQGILVSALAFAAAHMDAFNFLILFAMGSILAYIYHKTGSLAACITAHAVNNGIAFFLMFTHHG